MEDEKKEKNIDLYTESLLADLTMAGEQYGGCELQSVYFGGGTPSLLPPLAITKILEVTKKYFSLAANIEITLEANPGTVTLDLFKEFKQAGINRLSLGVQSFNDKCLRSIGRIHDREQALAAVLAIKSSGFTNFNLDLMFGLPGQDVDSALADLHQVLSLNPTHLSWYQLTLESSIREFSEAKFLWSQLPSSKRIWDIQCAGQDFLSKHGYIQYEVAAYSRLADTKCLHNINYWQYGDYLGIGAGAHSKVTLNDHIIKRYWQISEPKLYMDAENFIVGEELVAKEKVPCEFMLNALRLYQPISYELFCARTGFTIEAIGARLQEAQNLGLVELSERSIITTKFGKNFLNNLLEIFL